MKRDAQITAGEIYHVYNRGVDKRKIFMDDNDHLRFIHDLFEFNDEDKTLNNGFRFNSSAIATGQQYLKQRKLLVEILVFALMPNHYHMLLKPCNDTGVSRFLKKVNGGYAQYFNKKYGRSGTLFESKFKAIRLENDAHFIHMPYYIHANPLDIISSEWREGRLKNHLDALKFLKNYRWSSFPDYIGEKNFPSVTQRDFLLKISGGTQEYKNNFINWLRSMQLNSVSGLTLEN
ncbi:MAG TPA: transposase [Candidatus Paceibacterota bacterium]